MVAAPTFLSHMCARESSDSALLVDASNSFHSVLPHAKHHLSVPNYCSSAHIDTYRCQAKLCREWQNNLFPRFIQGNLLVEATHTRVMVPFTWSVGPAKAAQVGFVDNASASG